VLRISGTNSHNVRLTQHQQLDSQALAAFGAACIDHGTATTGLHANQKPMGAGAADFGGLVSTFHRYLDQITQNTIRGTDDYRKFS